MTRVYNFSAGPATLPAPVLARIRDEIPEWNGAGMSVMEMSHRGTEFAAIAGEAEERLRRLMAIPEHYRALFVQGGAQLQFSVVPMNLLRGRGSADYVNTGSWSSKAIDEAERYCRVNVAASSEASGFDRVPAQEEWRGEADAAYLHYTPNETIAGVEFHWIPDTGETPLVADMSSTILSRPVPVERFGLIYAGAQKNVGIAGLTVVIVRDDLLGDADGRLPGVLSYEAQAAAGSMVNTAPTFAWYVAGLVLEWLEAEGGLAAIGERNLRKATTLYEAIDASDFYSNPVEPSSRSRMNVTFQLVDPTLDARFLEQAGAAGLAELKGHRSVGGMRASIYNAMPQAGVEALVEFMQAFEKDNG